MNRGPQGYRRCAGAQPQPGAAVVLIQTRWHMDDLAGHLLREKAAEGWEMLSLPAIAESDESFRKTGDALWPDIKWPLMAEKESRCYRRSAEIHTGEKTGGPWQKSAVVRSNGRFRMADEWESTEVTIRANRIGQNTAFSRKLLSKLTQPGRLGN